MAKQLTLYDPSRVVPRKCGDCVSCCLAPTLKVEPHKPLGQRCSEVCDGRKKGCGIYETRPEGCKTYECHWLRNNLLDRQHRPDRIGIIFDDGEVRRPGFWDKLPNYDLPLPPLTAREVWPGAFKRQYGLLRELAMTTVVILVKPDGVQVIGPSDEVVRAVEQAIQ